MDSPTLQSESVGHISETGFLLTVFRKFSVFSEQKPGLFTEALKAG